MKKDIVRRVSQYLNFKHVKYEHQKLGGLTQRLVIPDLKQERITIDFVLGFPWTLKKFYIIWVIVDQPTRSAHFIMVMTYYTLEKLAQIYFTEIVQLHGVPFLSFRIMVLSSHCTFGQLFSECWVYKWSLGLHSTRRRMVSPSGLFRSLMIC